MIILCRLSEVENWNVLLLEAGGQEPDLSDIPAFTSLLKGTNIDRKYVSQNENVSCGGRPCPMPRGIVLGGTSTINAMLYIRGSPEDYDHWAELGHLLLLGKVLTLIKV
jgi:choline dehydrogenase